jgi:transcriptional regulator with XRE-family HTH domain
MTRRNTTTLKWILEDEGRKQSWLASRTGISTSRICHIANGLHPTKDEACAIADALRKPVSEVFPPEPERLAA